MNTIELINPASPDLILKKNPYKKGALARMAHVNEVISNINSTIIPWINSFSTGFEGVLVLDGTYLPAVSRITVTDGLTTGGILEYELNTKVSGYIYNGVVTGSTLLGSFIEDDFTFGSTHEPTAADSYTLASIRKSWEGVVVMDNPTTIDIISLIMTTEVGTGVNAGGRASMLNLNFSPTLNDNALDAYGILINFTPTITSMQTAYGIRCVSSGAITASADFEHVLGGRVSILNGGSTSGITIYGTVTSGITIDGNTAKTNALYISTNTGITNFATFDSTGGCVTVGTVAVPANYEAYLTVLIGATPYKIPLLA